MKKLNKAALAVAAVAAVAAPLAVSVSSPAEAAVVHKVVFKAWGVESKARVGVLGKTDITMLRSLPYHTTQYLSGIDYTFAMISVEDPHGYAMEGCSITVDGKLVSRDVSTFGLALCSR